MEKEIRQLETALNELHKSNDVTRAAHSTLKFAVEQVKNCTIPVVMPSAIEQFNCRFYHIQEMVANKGITKDNLISIQLVDEDKLNGDLYKVVHWA